MTSILSVLGSAMPAVYSLAGVLIGGWIARRSQHRHWVHDNKAREYKELLDSLHECITSVIAARPNLSTWDHPAVNNAMMQASRTFANRIFISGTLKKEGLIDECYKVKRLVFSEPGELDADGTKLVYGVTSLGVLEQKLQDKIIAASQRDLGLRP